MSDTGSSFSQNFNSLVELPIHLLGATHEYVMLGHFTSYLSEKQFENLRQGLGLTYFITFQPILEKGSIYKNETTVEIRWTCKGFWKPWIYILMSKIWVFFLRNIFAMCLKICQN